MLKIAICDAVEGDRNRISNFCNEFLKDKIIKYEILEYKSGETFLAEVFPDILFIDTQICWIDGILVKDILDKMQADTKIVFVSNQAEKMESAFGRNVYGFVKKPISYEIFFHKMTSMLRDVNEKHNMVFCKNRHQIEKILFKDILYIQAYGKYTKLYIQGREQYLLCDKTFGEWYLETENTEFLCCHRSYLVNMFYIKDVGKEIEMVNGLKVPIGESKRKEFWISYKMYMRRIGI